MGCKTGLSNGGCSGDTLNTSSCNKYDPKTGGVTFTYTEYPQSPIRTGSHNVPTREANFVMYDSVEGNASVTASSQGCLLFGEYIAIFGAFSKRTTSWLTSGAVIDLSI